MFYLKFSILNSDGYYIKPDILINAPEPYVGIGRIYYSPYLAVVHKVPRVTVVSAGTCLDLYENYSVFFPDHQVQFFVAAPPVTVQYHITVLFKISGGNIFTFLP